MSNIDIRRSGNADRTSLGYPVEEHPAVQPNTKDLRVAYALELFRQDPSISSAEMARRLNLSASRLRHLFKEELNISPVLYIKTARLLRAKALIEGSLLRIKEVAAMVGASDLSHFVRDYKRFYSQTPSQTRRCAWGLSQPERLIDSHNG